MKNPILKLAAFALPLFLASCSGGDKGPAVTGVTVAPATLSLSVGGADATATLTASVLPADAGDRGVAWTVVPPTGVVTVSGSGPSATVTAVADGTATITATSTADGTKKGECAVTVATPVAGVTMSQPAMLLYMGGEPGRLTAAVLPEGAGNRAVQWSSSDPATAWVSGDGATATVTPWGNGTATVTAASVADGAKKATCVVTVTTPVTGVSLDRGAMTLGPGRRSALAATVHPETAVVQTVAWETSDPGVATVEGGLVTAVAFGSATITARTAEGGFTAACAVTVRDVSVRAPRRTLAGSDAYYLAIREDGGLWAWGLNQFGQLGQGDTEDRSVPVRVGADTDWVSVSTGGGHNAALKADGTLWVWGRNDAGGLGQGDMTDRHYPVQLGEDRDWADAYAGCYHTVAIKTDGTVWACGDNTWGQVGDGTGVRRYTLVQVGGDADWITVVAGWYHNFGVKADGSLWAWGMNQYGQLGLGDASRRLAPARVGSADDWHESALAAGGYHTLAVRPDGSLWSWGFNINGQLGNGAAPAGDVPNPTPARVGAAADWAGAALAGGHQFSMAVKAVGGLWAWGRNMDGQLGLGDKNQRNSPARVGDGWAAAAGCAFSSAALRADGGLWASGSNEYGQLGDGTDVDRTAFVQIGTGFRVPAK
jgi:alpha-tubulin suppressor-like RCC1 family protein/uncharacterized protein YjdB